MNKIILPPHSAYETKFNDETQSEELHFTKGKKGDVSDSYHTFNELYRHRYVLFIAVCRLIYKELMWTSQGASSLSNHVWISKKHADGTMFDDSFIVGAYLPTGQVSYHLPMREWERVAQSMPLAVVKRAPEWDGHTPDDVIKRLEDWAYSKDDAPKSVYMIGLDENSKPLRLPDEWDRIKIKGQWRYRKNKRFVRQDDVPAEILKRLEVNDR